MPYLPACVFPRNSLYTVNRFRPFARLLLRTNLPPLVAILTRKPWVLFLFMLLVFLKVFFMTSILLKV
jgi:hypothetical protein